MTETITNLSILSGGKWVRSRSERFGDVFNPSTGEVIARVPLCTADEVDSVVRAAHGALADWAAVPVVERVRVLFKYREILLARFEELARCVTREHGKTLAEAPTAVAQHVYETGTKHGKRVQAAGGAKNHVIIMPDADLDQAAAAVQASAFGCAGERCMAGSIALPVGSVADELVERLTRIGQSM